MSKLRRPRMVLGISLAFSILAASGLFARAAEPPVHECDRLAADPFDRQRNAPAVAVQAEGVVEAERACREAIELFPDEPRFAFQLGRVLLMKREPHQALVYLNRAASKGYATAEYYLGLTHERGWLGEQDRASAIQWYLRAANNGHQIAQLALSSAYKHGLGVEKDISESLRWYKAAADQGYIFPHAEQGNIHAKMRESDIDFPGIYNDYLLREGPIVLNDEGQDVMKSEARERLLRKFPLGSNADDLKNYLISIGCECIIHPRIKNAYDCQFAHVEKIPGFAEFGPMMSVIWRVLIRHDGNGIIKNFSVHLEFLTP